MKQLQERAFSVSNLKMMILSERWGRLEEVFLESGEPSDQWYAGKCLAVGSPIKNSKSFGLFADPFANFHGVNISTKVVSLDTELRPAPAHHCSQLCPMLCVARSGNMDNTPLVKFWFEKEHRSVTESLLCLDMLSCLFFFFFKVILLKFKRFLLKYSWHTIFC